MDNRTFLETTRNIGIIAHIDAGHSTILFCKTDYILLLQKRYVLDWRLRLEK